MNPFAYDESEIEVERQLQEWRDMESLCRKWADEALIKNDIALYQALINHTNELHERLTADIPY